MNQQQRSPNFMEISGWIAKDVAVTYTKKNNKAILNNGVRFWSGKGQDGKNKYGTLWFTAWEDLAIQISPYQKGDLIHVRGYFVDNSYQKQGSTEKVYGTKVNVTEVVSLAKNDKNNQQQNQQPHGFSNQQQAPAPVQPAQQQAPAPGTSQAVENNFTNQGQGQPQQPQPQQPQSQQPQAQQSDNMAWDDDEEVPF